MAEGQYARLLQELNSSPRPLMDRKISEDLYDTMVALVDASEIETVRLLQGRAKAYRTILKYPQQVATLAASEKDDT